MIVSQHRQLFLQCFKLVFLIRFYDQFCDKCYCHIGLLNYHCNSLCGRSRNSEAGILGTEFFQQSITQSELLNLAG